MPGCGTLCVGPADVLGDERLAGDGGAARRELAEGRGADAVQLAIRPRAPRSARPRAARGSARHRHRPRATGRMCPATRLSQGFRRERAAAGASGSPSLARPPRTPRRGGRRAPPGRRRPTSARAPARQRLERRDRDQLAARRLRDRARRRDADPKSREGAGADADAEPPDVAPAQPGLGEHLAAEPEQPLGVCRAARRAAGRRGARSTSPDGSRRPATVAGVAVSQARIALIARAPRPPRVRDRPSVEASTVSTRRSPPPCSSRTCAATRAPASAGA